MATHRGVQVAMGTTIKEYETRWGIHSIVDLDGEPYAVVQEWALWIIDTSSYRGGCGITSIPNNNVRVIPLKELITDDNMEELRGDLL